MTDNEILDFLSGHETPAYIFDADALRDRVSYLRSSLPEGVGLVFAVKADPFVVREIAGSVDRLEICSPGEYEICSGLNTDPHKFVISGVYKSEASVRRMMSEHRDIGIYTAESPEQFSLIASLSAEYGIDADVLLRLTSGSQFGMSEEDIIEIVKSASACPNINIRGIQYFSGTQKHSLKRLKRELDQVDSFIAKLKNDLGFEVGELEFGPGFPVYYFMADQFDEEGFLAGFNELLSGMTYSGPLYLELGRSLTASCGTYITKVVDAKSNNGENYAVVDGGMNHIMYYGQTMAMKIPHYRLFPVRDDKAVQPWNICGSLCTTNDIIVKQLPVSQLKVGDVFAFENTGAYCMTEGLSLFLSRDLPAVYLKRGNEMIQVRGAVSTYQINMPDYKESK